MIDMYILIKNALDSNKNIYLERSNKIDYKNNKLIWKNDKYYIKNCTVKNILKEIDIFKKEFDDNFIKIIIFDLKDKNDKEIYFINYPKNFM